MLSGPSRIEGLGLQELSGVFVLLFFFYCFYYFLYIFFVLGGCVVCVYDFLGTLGRFFGVLGAWMFRREDLANLAASG